MKEYEIEELLFYAQGLLNHYKEFRRYIVTDDIDESPIYTEKNPPTRRVVTIGDYISVFVDLQNALLILNKDTDVAVRKSLEAALANIKAILVNHIKKKDMLRMLEELLEYLQQNINQIGTDDLTYFEIASGNREMIAKRIHVLDNLLSTKQNDVLLFDLLRKLERTDAMLKNSMRTLKRALPDIEKPFPRRPFYKPKSYWWFLE